MIYTSIEEKKLVAPNNKISFCIYFILFENEKLPKKYL